MDPIILTLIIIVVTIQIGIFIRTWHSLNKYVNIFKRVAFDRDEESHTIVVHDPSLFLSDNIVAPINQYLSKNEGAVADFYLKNRHKTQRKAKFYLNNWRSVFYMQGGLKQALA